MPEKNPEVKISEDLLREYASVRDSWALIMPHEFVSHVDHVSRIRESIKSRDHAA